MSFPFISNTWTNIIKQQYIYFTAGKKKALGYFYQEVLIIT